ncbi:hypothetical protein E2C01_024640 [Portunus trituberculatus]|uniref:Uncharacterized protein n=1 Tax=Portunus trituberculatus TaxID=210409 RepID=A0A5B7EEB3_PORTR|nr:hypothetical protein [Portunus trituberculatus]
MEIQHFFELFLLQRLLSKPFHTSTHLCGKLNFLISLLQLSFLNFFQCPLVSPVSQLNKSSLSNFSSPFIALYTALMASLSLLCSKVVRPSIHSHFSYDRSLKLGGSFAY